MSPRILLPPLLALLAGCAGQTPGEPPPAPAATLPQDPQRCATRADCSTKVSRTLLFVFDYAAAGAPLMQRRERLLFTPEEAAPGDWPALRIRLAEPLDGRFEFAAECRLERCRYDAAQLLRVYRSYLAGEPCSLLEDEAVRACAF